VGLQNGRVRGEQERQQYTRRRADTLTVAMIRTLVACSVTFVMLAPHEASGIGCGIELLANAMARNVADVVFDGTVVSVRDVLQGEAVTFDVRQVWKGNVTKQFSIYHVARRRTTQMPDRWGLPFPQGQRYIVFAHCLTAWERGLFDVGDVLESFGTDACRDGSQPVTPSVLNLLPGIQPR